MGELTEFFHGFNMRSILISNFSFAILCLFCALSPAENKNIATRYSGTELYPENNIEQLREHQNVDKFLALENLVAKIDTKFDENTIYDQSEESLSLEENLIRVRRSPVP